MPVSAENVIGKLIAGSALLFAAFLVILCPCEKVVRCHIGWFYGALIVAIVVAVYFNGTKFM